jgi:hypothetical protein
MHRQHVLEIFVILTLLAIVIVSVAVIKAGL